MRKIEKLNEKRETNRGITLIALVITIIVLLILAAVSIATLTGENGILTKAQTAKKETNEATAKEKVQVAVMGSYNNEGSLDPDQLKENLEKVEGLTGASNKLPATVKVDGYDVMITDKGEVIIIGSTSNPIPATIKEAKEQIYTFNSNTELQDENGNKVKVPEGFKIAADSANDVTGGVVIEDVSHEETAGSQFVWIPVGTIYTNVEKTQSKTIRLDRYSFAENGTPTAQGNSVIDSYCQELATSSYGNTTAKDIEAFKTSVTKNKGYYIGRYEARTATERTAKTEDSELGQLTVKANEYVYNWVTQFQAAKLSREMFEGETFTSDLMNSYAWDTAIVFIQEFSGDNDYARQNSLNTSLAKQGTKYLGDSTKHDQVCNIWDMASNVSEWTTESSSYSNYPNIFRGGDYYNRNFLTSSRISYYMSYAENNHAFRLVLYF